MNAFCRVLSGFSTIKVFHFMAGKILVYKEYNKIEELTLQEDHEVHCAES